MKLLSVTLILASLFSANIALSAEPEVGTIYDTDRIWRREVARSYGLISFGPASFHKLGIHEAGQYLSYQHIWETTPYAAIRAGGEGAFFSGADESASMLNASLGANFYFTPTSFSPYLGFDFGYGHAATSDSFANDVHGWTGGLVAGLALFRTSSVQMHVTGRYSRVFVDNRRGQPSHASLGIGVAF